jgi:hypothetical protein
MLFKTSHLRRKKLVKFSSKFVILNCVESVDGVVVAGDGGAAAGGECEGGGGPGRRQQLVARALQEALLR